MCRHPLRERNAGAGEGNRTLVISLEGCCSTIELHPRSVSSALRRPLVGEVGLEPKKAAASGFTVRPLCRSGHSPVSRVVKDFQSLKQWPDHHRFRHSETISTLHSEILFPPRSPASGHGACG